MITSTTDSGAIGCAGATEEPAGMLTTVLNIDGYLAANKYEVDPEPHIVLRGGAAACDPAEFDKLMLACPAALYRRDERGVQSFDYSGCLECGTCRILCGGTIIEAWRNPSAGCGVEYRLG